MAKDYRTNLIKIGFSDQPTVREKTLQSEAPHIELIFITLGGRSTESALHLRYKEFRVRGEWFALSKEQIEEIIASNPILYRKTENNFLSSAAENLLEILRESTQESFSPNFLANNLFIDTRNLRPILEELKKKKIIKYKWKINIEVNVLV